jgi:hypothetical protein
MTTHWCKMCQYWELEPDPGTYGRCKYYDWHSMPQPLYDELCIVEDEMEWPFTFPKNGEICPCWQPKGVAHEHE